MKSHTDSYQESHGSQPTSSRTAESVIIPVSFCEKGREATFPCADAYEEYQNHHEAFCENLLFPVKPQSGMKDLCDKIRLHRVSPIQHSILSPRKPIALTDASA